MLIKIQITSYLFHSSCQLKRIKLAKPSNCSEKRLFYIPLFAGKSFQRVKNVVPIQNGKQSCRKFHYFVTTSGDYDLREEAILYNNSRCFNLKFIRCDVRRTLTFALYFFCTRVTNACFRDMTNICSFHQRCLLLTFTVKIYRYSAEQNQSVDQR